MDPKITKPVKTHVNKSFENQLTFGLVFLWNWNDFGIIFGSLGPSKPSKTHWSYNNIQKIVWCNFGNRKNLSWDRFWSDFSFKLGPTSTQNQHKSVLKKKMKKQMPKKKMTKKKKPLPWASVDVWRNLIVSTNKLNKRKNSDVKVRWHVMTAGS